VAHTFIYYHRLQFPSESGQTLQVLRDYHAVAAQGERVHLFYRSHRPLTESEIEQLLAQCGLSPLEALQFHLVASGPFGKLRLRRHALALARAADADTPVFVCRTLDHALAALQLRTLRLSRARVVLELHETAIPHMIYAEAGRPARAQLSRWIEGLVFHRVDAIIATVGSQLDVLQQHYPRHAPAHVLPNGVPARFFDRFPSNASSQPFRLRYAGQLNAWKNTEVMIEALQHLPADVVLDIAGGKVDAVEDTRRVLAQNAARHGVSGRVNYFGCLPPASVPAFLYGAHALLLPLGENASSRYFTSPMKLFEYAATGIPMVVTRQPTTLSLIKDGTHALMVEPRSAIALAEAVARLRADALLGERLGKNARAWAELHRYERRATQLREFLREVGI
jgi:glycosyltransferase involved in cell wall biosynthesis